MLDLGCPRIRLEGVSQQRLLLWGLRGPWEAAVEIHGHAGPELAAELDAPGLIVLAHDPVDAGVGQGMLSGSVWVRAAAGELAGYGQAGGVLVVQRHCGDRAGLRQRGGLLMLLGSAGRLAGERQSGGMIVCRGPLGPLAQRGQTGGLLVHAPDRLEPGLHDRVLDALGPFRDWVDLDESTSGGDHPREAP